MGLNTSKRNQSNIKLVAEKVYMPDDYDEKKYNEPYHGLNIPTAEEYLKTHERDAEPVDRSLLAGNKDAKLRNNPDELIFHRVKFNQDQWDFLLDEASNDMTQRLREIYADMILREGEFKFRVGRVKYLGPGRPGNCQEVSCNRRIGTAYYLEPIDPTRKDLGDFPEYVGSTCITKIAGIDPNTAMEIKRMEQDAKGERDSIAERIEECGDFDEYLKRYKIDDKILLLNSITDKEIDDFNRCYGYGEDSRRRLTRQKVDNRLKRANEFLQRRLPLPKTLEGHVNNLYNRMKWQRSEAFRRDKYKKELFQQEQERKRKAFEYQLAEAERKKKAEYYTKFCEDYLQNNPSNGFIKSLNAQLARGRTLSPKQEAALVKIIKQSSGIFEGNKEPDKAKEQRDKIAEVIAKVETLAQKKNDKGLHRYIDYLNNTLLKKLEQDIPLTSKEDLKHYNKALNWIRKK